MTKEKLFLFILSYSQKVKLRYVNFLGKTSLCQRFAHNYFTSKYTPTNGVQRSVIIAVIETDPKTRRQSLVFQNSFHKSVTPSFVERKKSTEVFLDEEDDGGSGPKKEPLEKKDSGARYRKVSQNSWAVYRTANPSPPKWIFMSFTINFPYMAWVDPLAMTTTGFSMPSLGWTCPRPLSVSQGHISNWTPDFTTNCHMEHRTIWGLSNLILKF